MGAVCRTAQDGSRILSVSVVEEEDGNAVWSWHVISCWDATTGHRISGPTNRPGRLPGVALPRN